MSINKTIFSGNLTKDPDVRYTPDGKAVVKFSIAVNEKYKDKESVEFVNCVAFDKSGEVIAKHFGKGSKIFVICKQKTQKWEKDGVTRYSTEHIVQDWDFGGGKSQSEGGEHAPEAPDDSEIPF